MKTPALDGYLKKFGERIIFLRSKYNLSQTELANLMEIDNANLRKLERGKKNATLLTIIKLSEAFSITISELLDFE